MIAMMTALAMTLAQPNAAAAGQPGEAEAGSDTIIQVSSDDPEMNAAIARGRSTLAGFYRRLAAPQGDDGEFMVKFDIAPGDEVEFVWAAELDRSRTPMTGILLNQPVYTKDRIGTRVAIPEDRIIDWGYRSNGVMQGSFTNRVLIGRMPSEQAASFRQFLGW